MEGINGPNISDLPPRKSKQTPMTSTFLLPSAASSFVTFSNVFFFFRYAYETYDLPEAYKGRNLFLRDTIDGFILDKNEWYTSVALPYAQTNDIHLAWNEWYVLHSFVIDGVAILTLLTHEN